MDTERMIRELRSVAQRHKNDKVFTGGLLLSDMCNDVANRLEELLEENQRLKSKQ